MIDDLRMNTRLSFPSAQPHGHGRTVSRGLDFSCDSEKQLENFQVSRRMQRKGRRTVNLRLTTLPDSQPQRQKPLVSQVLADRSIVGQVFPNAGGQTPSDLLCPEASFAEFGQQFRTSRRYQLGPDHVARPIRTDFLHTARSGGPV